MISFPCASLRGNSTCFHPSSTFTAYTHPLTNMFFPNDSICKFSNPPNDCISLQTHLSPSSQHSISLSSNHTSSGTSNKAFLNYRSHTQVVDAAPHRAREHAVLQTGVTFGYAPGFCACGSLCVHIRKGVSFFTNSLSIMISFTIGKYNLNLINLKL